MLDSCIIIIDTFTNTPIYRIESITKFKKNKKNTFENFRITSILSYFCKKKVNGYSKNISLRNIFRIFLWEEKKVTEIFDNLLYYSWNYIKIFIKWSINKCPKVSIYQTIVVIPISNIYLMISLKLLSFFPQYLKVIKLTPSNYYYYYLIILWPSVMHELCKRCHRKFSYKWKIMRLNPKKKKKKKDQWC